MTMIDDTSVPGVRDDVSADLEIEDQDTRFHVVSVDLHERLGTHGDGFVTAIYPATTHIDRRELLSKNACVTLHRGDRVRRYRGIIKQASLGRVEEGQALRIEITPALWLLTETLDSRIYQDKTVPDLVEEIVDELLSGRRRTVRRELTETYEAHEYLVQHRESHYAFLSRLCQEEGIFIYFDHDDDDSDHEVLVLADSNDNRPEVLDGEGDTIPFDASEAARRGREIAFYVGSEHRVGATDAVVRGYDWSSPALEVQHEKTDRGRFAGPKLEVYDHHHALRHARYDEGAGTYRAHDADKRARMHTERLDLARAQWDVGTTVLGATPGKVFELSGADDHDDRYLVVGASSRAHLSSGGGDFENTLQVVPRDLPYRPPPPPRRSMPGPETATVVGPAGEEIHTDQHGRIRVKFHWDRLGRSDETASAWIRVAHAWAGAGFGSIFVPRVGMEVLVSFLGGDPDRPVVTGCLYNGDNRVPYPLPDDKTKSTIKTQSSPGGGGSNELRFEDEAGSEQVYVHAQKDLDEVVENDHTTRVKANQRNTVDGHQTVKVHRDRDKTVDGNETTKIGEDRTETVAGEESITLEKSRRTEISDHETLLVGGDRALVVTGRDDEQIDSGRKVVVKGSDRLEVVDGADRTTLVSGQYSITVAGQKYELTHAGTGQLRMQRGTIFLDAEAEIVASTGGSRVTMLSNGTIRVSADTKLELQVGGCKIEMDAATIKMSSGASSLEIGPAGIMSSSPLISGTAQGLHEIAGGVVTIG